MRKHKLHDTNSLPYRLEYAMIHRDMCGADITRKADKMGITIGSSNISQYLSGTYIPKKEKIVALSRILAVPELWLMGLTPLEDLDGKGLKEYSNPVEAEILTHFRSLNMNGKDLVMRMLRTIADTQEYRHYPQNINP